jgi:hypothetical protein
MRSALLVVAALLLPGLGTAADQRAQAPVSDADFCARAQRIITGTRIPAVNLVFTAREDFVQSKPRVRPLETDQFVTHGDAAGKRPRIVSCKMKSSDHLLAEYGPGAAAAEGACRNINADTVARVFAALTPAQRERLLVDRDRIVLEADDEALTGASWTNDVFEPARRSEAGELLIRARSIRVDWNDWKWAWMPDRFRGQHSCHLIAPEYLRSLVLGTWR